MISIYMKLISVILTWIALVSLLVPCAHGEVHQHEAVSANLCSGEHADCRSAEDDPCAKPKQVVFDAPVHFMDIAFTPTCLIAVLSTDRPVSVLLPRPPDELQRLQTVQLLI